MSQINLSSTSKEAIKASAHQTFGQLRIISKILLSSQTTHSLSKARNGDRRRGENLLPVLWNSLIFKITLILQPLLIKDREASPFMYKKPCPMLAYVFLGQCATRYHFFDPAPLPA